ncbi:MAG: acyl-CoA dehydrogenase family protein, partial [Nitrososphaerota archaeon]
MDFEFTPEQIQVRDMVREWAQREVAPFIREWDAKGEYHPEIYRRMG